MNEQHTATDEPKKPQWKIEPAKPGASPECTVPADTQAEAEAVYRKKFPKANALKIKLVE